MDRYTYCFFLLTFVVFGWVAFEECYCWDIEFLAQRKFLVGKF